MTLEPTYDDRGLIPAIVQDATTGDVLMLGYVNEASMAATVETGLMHFWSRKRNRLWMKGETSGNTMEVIDLQLDCDADTLLARVEPAGPACHTGATTCFDTNGATDGERRPGGGELHRLWATIRSRAEERPSGSYTTALLDKGVDACARKVTEEATEVLIAAKDHADGHGSAARVIEESADLAYHLLVLLAERGITLAQIEEELDRRAG